MRSVVALVVIATAAHARPIHGAIGAGGSLVLLGEDGDRLRSEVAFNLKWRSRYGGSIAWRAFDQGSLGDGKHDGMVLAGLVYEGGAARPRLVLDLIVEAGVDLDQKAPVVGGGILNTLTIIGPLGVQLHTGAYLVVDGVDDSRFHLQSNLLVSARW